METEKTAALGPVATAIGLILSIAIFFGMMYAGPTLFAWYGERMIAAATPEPEVVMVTTNEAGGEMRIVNELCHTSNGRGMTILAMSPDNEVLERGCAVEKDYEFHVLWEKSSNNILSLAGFRVVKPLPEPTAATTQKNTWK